MIFMDASETLASAFYAQFSGSVVEPVEALLDLDSVLRQLVISGRTAWPDLPLSAMAFVSYLARRVPRREPVLKSLSELHANDLYLACGCALGIPKALVAFDHHYLGQVRAWVTRINPSPSFADDVSQSVREKLFVPRHSESAKITEYSGRGQLLSWLRVAAMRTAIDLARKFSTPRASGAEDIDDQILKTDASPEAAYIKARYSGLLKDAFRLALKRLSDEEHNLIRLYYEDGLSMEQLGTLFGVNRSTIKRRLDESYSRLQADIKRYIHEHLQISSAQLRSLVTLLISRFELTSSSR